MIDNCSSNVDINSSSKSIKEVHFASLDFTEVSEFPVVCPHQLRVFPTCQDVSVLSSVLFAGALEPWRRLQWRGWRRGGRCHLLFTGRDGLLKPKAQNGLTVIICEHADSQVHLQIHSWQCMQTNTAAGSTNRVQVCLKPLYVEKTIKVAH